MAEDLFDRALVLVMDGGQTLLANGGEVFRVQQTMEIMAASLGVQDFHVYVLTNGIFASAHLPGGESVTLVRHVPTVSIHLGRVEAVNELSRELAAGKLGVVEAEQKLAAARALPRVTPRREVLAFMADHYDGLVIEGFGVGGLPEYDGFYDVVRQAAEAGKLIVMTTQVPNEGSDLTVYHVGGHLKHTLQVLEAYDMTTESAVCKLMWILGQTRDFAQAEKLFYTPVSRDILRFSGE